MARPEISDCDADLGQFVREEVARRVHVGLALVALLGDELLDLLVLARMEALEGEVLELPLDRVDPEAVGERRVDLERLAGLLELLLLRQRRERAHVVEAVGELDQDDPDVRGHRDHHLAVVLGLVLVAALERDPRELRDAVDQSGDRVAEELAHLVEARRRVLDRVVEERRAERLRVQAKAGADLRDLDRVRDEVLARAAALVDVALAGEREGLLDRTALECLGAFVRVLLDHREEVAEERALVLVQTLRELVVGQRRAGAVAVGADPRVPRGLRLGVLYAAASSGLELGFSGWLRYRTHSSLAFSMRRKLIDDERSPLTEDTASARIAGPLGSDAHDADLGEYAKSKAARLGRAAGPA